MYVYTSDVTPTDGRFAHGCFLKKDEGLYMMLMG